MESKEIRYFRKNDREGRSILSAKTVHKFGYARVSSKDQNLARQISALKEAGIDEKSIFIDRQSGKDFDRPGYRKLQGMNFYKLITICLQTVNFRI